MINERIPTDNPIRHIWARLEVISTFSGAKTFLQRKAEIADKTIADDIINGKAKGIAFCVRNAREYFKVPIEANFTIACLSYYYGTLSLLEALLLSDLENDLTLNNIEAFTISGHGLRSIINKDEGAAFPTSEYLIILRDGFFSKFLQYNGYNIEDIAVSKKYTTYPSSNQLRESERAALNGDNEKFINIIDLLNRVPELKSIYSEIFRKQPNYIRFSFEELSPDTPELILKCKKYDNTEFLNEDTFYDMIGCSRDNQINITKEYGSEYYATSVNVPRTLIEKWGNYSSVMAKSCSVKPIVNINDVLLIDFMLLYTLSIWVRYRPALWREIIEGDYDLYRPLISNFLIAVERVIPNIVLNRLYEKKFVFSEIPIVG